MISEDKMKMVVEALEELKHANPWKGTIEERKSKFIRLHERMNAIFGRKLKLLFNLPPSIKDWGDSGQSCYFWNISGVEGIKLCGRLSVITFLHEWGHALGMEQEDAQKWAVELFKRIWPEKFAKLVEVGGGMLKLPISSLVEGREGEMEVKQEERRVER